MIRVYDSSATDYSGNGLAVLQPLACTISEEAGGSYELSLTHPLDSFGLWQTIQAGNVIKAPTPLNMTEGSTARGTVTVGRVTAKTPLRAKPSLPSSVNYPAWVNPSTSMSFYSVGDKVSYGGSNYMCTATPTGFKHYMNPAAVSSCWKKVASTTGGGEVLMTLTAGTYVYFLSTQSSSWYRVMTMDGIEGYMLVSAYEYSHKVKPERLAPAEITEQLFRIYETSVDTKKHTVTANARHVSYDLAGDIIGSCIIKNQTPAVALALIKNALINGTHAALGTNLTDDTDGRYTADHTHKNGISALLDPEGGFLAYYKGKLLRNNFDIYIYRNDKPDRGVRLEYGVNLQGVTWSTSSESIVTRVIPVAKNSDGSDLYLDNRYVDSPLIDAYPVVMAELMNVDGKVGSSDGDGGTWTLESLTDHMQTQAQRRFDVDNADKLKTEIKVNFTLLGDTVEYRQYKALERLCLYDTVTVIDPNIGLEERLQMSKYTWDAITGRYTEMTLGDVYNYTLRSICAYEIANGSLTYDKLSPAAKAKIKGEEA